MIKRIIEEHGMELPYWKFRTILTELEGIHYHKEYYHQKYGNYVHKCRLINASVT